MTVHHDVKLRKDSWVSTCDKCVVLILHSAFVLNANRPESQELVDRQIDLHSEPQPVPESPVRVAVLSMLVLPNKP